MGSKVTIDFSDSFDGDFEKFVKGSVKDLARDWQKMFDSLLKRYSGESVSTIKPVLRREWRKLGASPAERDLTEYASLLSEGSRIEVKVK